MISQHEFLTDAECDALLEKLRSHEDIAIDRAPDRPGKFVTFGRASYLDVCLDGADPEAQYYSQIQSSNRALWGTFEELYERLRSRMETLLGEPVRYDLDSLALPGIHVFRAEGIRSAGDGGSHFDVQFERIRLPRAPDPSAPPLSITVPIAIPENGTGLRVHDVTYRDYERAYKQGRIGSVEELARRKTSSYHPYARGALVLHRGLVYHGLTSPGPLSDSDERITIQGHGLRCDGEWILYW